MGLEIDIAVEHDAWGILGDIDTLVERAVVAAITTSGRAIAEDAELSVLLCDDAFIHELNRNWRDKDEPTNVLSFPTAGSQESLGDIVIAFETTAREAAEEGRSLQDHFTHLVVHGLFHLFGFDHESDEEAEVMEALETQSLMTLGIASPYQESPRALASESDFVDSDSAELDPPDLDSTDFGSPELGSSALDVSDLDGPPWDAEDHLGQP